MCQPARDPNRFWFSSLPLVRSRFGTNNCVLSHNHTANWTTCWDQLFIQLNPLGLARPNLGVQRGREGQKIGRLDLQRSSGADKSWDPSLQPSSQMATGGITDYILLKRKWFDSNAFGPRPVSGPIDETTKPPKLNNDKTSFIRIHIYIYIYTYLSCFISIYIYCIYVYVYIYIYIYIICVSCMFNNTTTSNICVFAKDFQAIANN